MLAVIYSRLLYINLSGPPLSVEESLLNDTDMQRCVGCQYPSMAYK